MLFPTGRWSRRRLLKSVPAVGASFVLPRGFPAATSEKTATTAKPFSTFTDIALNAGLTKKMFYGTPEGRALPAKYRSLGRWPRACPELVERFAPRF